MKSIQYHEFGGPEVLQIVERPDPHPGPGQVRVAVRAVGINPIDWKMRRGLTGGDLPQGTGREVAGVVDELGDGVSDVTLGQEVFGFAAGGGGASEFALLADYAPIPASLEFAHAAGLPVAVETAVRTLDLLGVGEGSTVLINGAAGGVGGAAVQIAVARGAGVIGTASEPNHAYLRSLGAEPTTERAVHALREIGGLIASGRFAQPVAGTFAFEEAAEAQRVSENGHVRGKLILLLG